MTLVGRGDMTQATRRLRDAARDVLNFHEEERARRGHKPAFGSPAWSEDLQQREFAAIDGHPAREPRVLGSVQLSLAEELIRSVCVLHESEMAVLASDKVLARSAIEAAARALWLLEPQIGCRARIARGLIERLEDARLQRRLVKGSEFEADYTATIERLEREANAAGMKTKTVSGEATRVDNQRRLRPTEAMKFVLDRPGDQDELGGILAQLLSLSVHGHAAALLMHRDHEHDLRDLGDGMYATALVMRSSNVNLTLGFCLLPYVVAVNANRALMGWTTDDRWTRVCVNYRNISRELIG